MEFVGMEGILVLSLQVGLNRLIPHVSADEPSGVCRQRLVYSLFPDRWVC